MEALFALILIFFLSYSSLINFLPIKSTKVQEVVDNLLFLYIILPLAMRLGLLDIKLQRKRNVITVLARILG